MSATLCTTPASAPAGSCPAHGRTLSRDERTSAGLTAQPRPAAQAKTCLQRPVLLSVFHGRPDEQADREYGRQKDKDGENDCGREVHVVIRHSVQPDHAAVVKISAIVHSSAGSRGSPSHRSLSRRQEASPC